MTTEHDDEIPWARALLFGSTFWMVLVVLVLAAPVLAEQLRTSVGPWRFAVGFATASVASWRVRVWRRRRFNPYNGLGTADEHIQSRFGTTTRDHDHG